MNPAVEELLVVKRAEAHARQEKERRRVARALNLYDERKKYAPDGMPRAELRKKGYRMEQDGGEVRYYRIVRTPMELTEEEFNALYPIYLAEQAEAERKSGGRRKTEGGRSGVVADLLEGLAWLVWVDGFIAACALARAALNEGIIHGLGMFMMYLLIFAVAGFCSMGLGRVIRLLEEIAAGRK